MRILITGASGQLGAYLIDNLIRQKHELFAWSGTELGSRCGLSLSPVDLTNPLLLQRELDRLSPDAILHVAAISSTEAVRLDPIRAQALNVDATRRLCNWAERRSRRLLFTSTDLVFDGSRAWNREDDVASPIVAYGQTKLDAEAAVLGISGGLVARLSLLYGPSKCGRPYFFERAIEAIRRGQPQSFFEDEFRTPLDLATASSILIHLLESNLAGLYHVAGADRLSRFELMRRAVRALDLDDSLVKQNRLADGLFAEPRPADLSLDTTKLTEHFPELHRPTIEEALASCLEKNARR